VAKGIWQGWGQPHLSWGRGIVRFISNYKKRKKKKGELIKI
jgi:hypothetical protein